MIVADDRERPFNWRPPAKGQVVRFADDILPGRWRVVVVGALGGIACTPMDGQPEPLVTRMGGTYEWEEAR